MAESVTTTGAFWEERVWVFPTDILFTDGCQVVKASV